MRVRALALLIGALAIAGCQHGLRPREYPPAYSAVGATVAYRLKGERTDRTGELFAVDSVGVTVHAGELMRVHWERLQWLEVKRLASSFNLFPNSPVTPEKRARLALVSRFPQGLSDPLLAQVLTTLRLERVQEMP